MMFIKMIAAALIIISVYIDYANCACAWDSCNPISTDPDVLNVHLIPHTHDDLGWLKTVDQYYYGTNKITINGVQYIYNTVIKELMKNEARRFTFAEAGFLYRWWMSNVNNDNDKDNDRLKILVANGQIELIGGGWVQNDEASAHYVDVIDQMTLGLKYLSDWFGDCGKPVSAWQIDPFGHSREMASLFSQMGYNSLSFARLHYEEFAERKTNKSMEMIWNTSEDLKTSLFTSAFYQFNYHAPPHFCFDVHCFDEPIQDNPDLGDYNVDRRVNEFIDFVKNQSTTVRTNNILVPMGGDFMYTSAGHWFVNMDKLIKHVNEKNTNIRVLYSTPSCYYQAVRAFGQSNKITWPTKEDDFFPYANAEHSYWTGYFTSRPAFKGMIRDASSIMQLGKSLSVLGGFKPESVYAVDDLKMASALAQHHDAVTGTAKQVVTYDYQKQLHYGMSQIEMVINSYLGLNATARTAALCFLANETLCETIMNYTAIQIVVFNPRARWANETIKIPYYYGNAKVNDSDGNAVDSYLVNAPKIASLNSKHVAPYELHIAVKIPPMGYAYYSIDNLTSESANIANDKLAVTNMENDFMKLVFDEKGELMQLIDKSSNTTHILQQQFLYYFGMDNRAPDHQPSGAYIFRPNGSDPVYLGKPTHFEYFDGNMVKEMRQTFGDWVYQTIRLKSDKNYIEFDWVIGPIPTDSSLLKKNNASKEVVTRYITDINNGDIFYTDSTGRQMLKRQRDFAPSYKYQDKEPIAANFYPLTNRIYIKDSTTQMTILTDRAEGGTAVNGSIEIMLHRRCLVDDHYGVNEPLNEPGKSGKGLVVRGSHYMVIGNPKTAAAVHRPLAVELFHKPIIAYITNENETNNYDITKKYSGLTSELPDNVHLLTLEHWGQWDEKTILLRLEHIYQSGEDEQKSKPVNVDFGKLFDPFDIVNVTELNLAANGDYVDKIRRDQSPRTTLTTSYVLQPMQIRTFKVAVRIKNWLNNNEPEDANVENF